MSKTSVRIAKTMLHQWEEPPIAGTRGAGAVFFCGCALQCVFCQNHDVSRGLVGKTVSVARMADIFRELEAQGAHNIELITATHYAPAVVRALELYRPALPIVWNSGGYDRPETLALLAPYVDVWLPDLKFMTAEVAGRYCRRSDYPPVAQAAIRTMCALAGSAVFDAEGLLRRGVIVRHLVLPGELANSLAALDFMAALPEGTLCSLMAQYTPAGELSAFPNLQQPLTAAEYGQVLAHLDRIGGLDGWTQQLDAADAAYIPDFTATE